MCMQSIIVFPSIKAACPSTQNYIRILHKSIACVSLNAHVHNSTTVLPWLRCLPLMPEYETTAVLPWLRCLPLYQKLVSYKLI